MTTVSQPFVMARTLGRIRMTDTSRVRAAESAAPFDLASAYDAHARVLLGYCVNALRDRGQAEDCVQETFLRAWRARDSYDPERSALRTWLFVIARSVILDAVRAADRRPRLAPAEALDGEYSPDADPLDRLQITEGLAKLSPEHREVVIAIHLRGATYSELAERTGVAVATLRSRSFYALRALRTHLDEYGSTS